MLSRECQIVQVGQRIRKKQFDKSVVVVHDSTMKQVVPVMVAVEFDVTINFK
jgi:hypothetical protein